MDVFQEDVLDFVGGEGGGVCGMLDEDLQAIVAGEIDEAADYIDNTMSTQRAYATDYYWGGRSAMRRTGACKENYSMFNRSLGWYNGCLRSADTTGTCATVATLS